MRQVRRMERYESAEAPARFDETDCQLIDGGGLVLLIVRGIGLYPVQ
jgi:hypothetical protein